MNRQFPALSGIAMLLIVLNHTITMNARALPPDAAPVQDWVFTMLGVLQSLGGVFAVPVFLFISGAFVSYAARGEPSRLTRKFVISSLVRILSPYIIWSIAFYVLIYLHLGQRYSLQGYIKNLFVGYPFHFIPLLIFFYLLSPLMVRLGRRHALWLITGIFVYQIFLLLLTRTAVLPAWMQVLSPPAIRGTLADWAVYFPLGLAYGLHMNSFLSPLRKIKWPLLFSTLLFFILSVLQKHGVFFLLFIQAASLSMVMILPVIERKAMPWVNRFESVGKRSYGLYLTNLIVLDLMLFGIESFIPGFMQYQIAQLPVLYFFALLVPLLAMNAAARSRVRGMYRYVFG